MSYCNYIGGFCNYNNLAVFIWLKDYHTVIVFIFSDKVAFYSDMLANIG